MADYKVLGSGSTAEISGNNKKLTKINLWDCWKIVKELQQPSKCSIKKSYYKMVRYFVAFLPHLSHPIPGTAQYWFGGGGSPTLSSIF